MATFLNPNDPPQPQPGVYGWFAQPTTTHLGSDACLYVGNAGGRLEVLRKGTLVRGVTELARCTFSSNSKESYNRVDTDFIVGTAIVFFEHRGMAVNWKHLDNNPRTECDYGNKLNPFLQRCSPKSLRIHTSLSLPDNDFHWKLKGLTIDEKRRKIAEAESRIFEQLETLIDAKATSNTMGMRTIKSAML